MDRTRLLELFKYDPCTGKLTWIVKPSARVRIGDEAGSINRVGKSYLTRVVKIDGRTYRVAVIIWIMMTDRWPADEVDHINRDALDNRWANLREVTRSQNNKNRNYPKHRVSKYNPLGAEK